LWREEWEKPRLSGSGPRESSWERWEKSTRSEVGVENAGWV
jgi:hypothetical protein